MIDIKPDPMFELDSLNKFIDRMCIKNEGYEIGENEFDIIIRLMVELRRSRKSCSEWIKSAVKMQGRIDELTANIKESETPDE